MSLFTSLTLPITEAESVADGCQITLTPLHLICFLSDESERTPTALRKPERGARRHRSSRGRKEKVKHNDPLDFIDHRRRPGNSLITPE